MAQRVVVELTDDLDGSPADHTVEFALDGKNYEIDLNSKNAEKLREAMDRYVVAARRPARRRTPSPARASSNTAQREENQAARAWLRENGYEVKDRGRIPEELLQAYREKPPAASTDVASTDKAQAANVVSFRAASNA